jgi:hypothetical protein
MAKNVDLAQCSAEKEKHKIAVGNENSKNEEALKELSKVNSLSASKVKDMQELRGQVSTLKSEITDLETNLVNAAVALALPEHNVANSKRTAVIVAPNLHGDCKLMRAAINKIVAWAY